MTNFWKVKRDDSGVNIDMGQIGQIERRLALSRRLPSQILRSTLDVGIGHGIIPCGAEIDGSKINTGAARQMEFIASTLENPTHGSYFLAIGVDDIENRALTLAGAIFVEAIRKHLADVSHYPYIPMWHWLMGGNYDKLRDARESEAKPRFNMLFLANLAVNSTQQKIEKARDLLQTHSHLPRVLIVAGGDPLEFCVEQLYMRPRRFVYLGNRRAPPKRTKI